MSEFNEHTALNRRLQEDAEATRHNADKARGNQMVRAINRAHRKAVTTVAIDAALVGASLSGVIAAAVGLICWVV